MTHLGYWAKPTSFLGTRQLRRIHGGTTCLSGQLIHGELRDRHNNNCDGTVTGAIKSQSTMVKTIHSLPLTTYYIFAKLLSLPTVTIQCNQVFTVTTQSNACKCNCPSSMGELLHNQRANVAGFTIQFANNIWYQRPHSMPIL